MRLDSIEAQNFFSHKFTKIDFNEVRSPLLVKGENGSGKSSLFTEALTFVIFGETKLASIDDAIREGASEMGVAVKFNLNGQDVEIMRTKKRGKSAKLTLTIDGESVEELLSETQKRIDNMFGLSYQSFLSSIILKQEDSNFFLKQKPDERKKIIREILDLGVYARLEKKSREERAQLKSEIKVEEGAYNAITIKDHDELTQKLAVLEAGNTKLKDEIQKIVRQHEEIIQSNQQVLEQQKYRHEILNTNASATQMIASLDLKIKNNQQQIDFQKTIEAPRGNPDMIMKANEFITKMEDELNELGKQMDQLRRELQTKTWEAEAEVRSRIDPLTKQMNEISGELNALNRQESEIKEGYYLTCPTCQQTVDQTQKDLLLEDLRKRKQALQNRLNELSPQRESIYGEQSILKEHETEWQKEYHAKIESIETEVTTKTNVMRKARTMYTENLEQLKRYEMAVQKIESLTQAIADMIQSREAFEIQIKPVPPLTMELKDETETATRIEQLKEAQLKTFKLTANIQSDIEQNEAAIERKTMLEQTIKAKMHRISLFEKLVIAFSNNGIPAAIIETVLPEIEQTANHFLSRMSQGRLSIQFKTSETMKNGNEKETLEIEVFDGTAWRRFESFSGGEQFRISLSIRLALSKVLSRRANVDLQLLILDEAATALDQPGREEFVQTVLSLTNDFSRIILMSHIPELAGEFENSITLGKSLDGTKLIGGK